MHLLHTLYDLSGFSTLAKTIFYHFSRSSKLSLWVITVHTLEAPNPLRQQFSVVTNSPVQTNENIRMTQNFCNHELTLGPIKVTNDSIWLVFVRKRQTWAMTAFFRPSTSTNTETQNRSELCEFRTDTAVVSCGARFETSPSQNGGIGAYQQFLTVY